MSLNLGLLLAFRNPPKWRRPWEDIYEEHIRQAELAEDLGYDEVWLTEHHFWEDGWCPALLPTAAAIAARTKTIRIGTFVILLPLGKHAINVVEEATVVDIISKGRLDLGLGLGYRVPEFQGYGIPRENRAQLMDEGLEIIQKAWTEETFSFKGEFYDLKNVHLEPTPVQDPHPRSQRPPTGSWRYLWRRSRRLRPRGPPAQPEDQSARSRSQAHVCPSGHPPVGPHEAQPTGALPWRPHQR